MLKINEQAPDFELEDQNGKINKLSGYRGRYVLVYFYPKDDTPGCTKEACGIRDAYGLFEKNGIKVFGISADSAESHKKFAEKYNLPFTLLSDPKKNVIKSFGAKSGILTRRVSYLIGPNGKVLKSYPKVDPANHGGQILEDFLEIKK